MKKLIHIKRGYIIATIYAIFIAIALYFIFPYSAANRTVTEDTPNSYTMTVSQTGGANSHMVSVDGLTASSEKTAGVVFWVPGDLNPMGNEPKWVGSSYSMWIGCKKGYVVIDAQSPTNNRLDSILMGVPGYGIGMEILDQTSNAIQITCQKG